MVQISPTHRRLEEGVVASHPEQAEADDQHAGDGATLEGHGQCRRYAATRRFGCPHVGTDRNVHADETGRPGEDGADQEAEGGQPTQFGNQTNDEEEDDANDRDGLVLSA